MRLPRLVALGVGLAAALAVDQGVRWVLPSEPPVDDRPRFLSWVRYHPILGWSGRPDLVDENDGIDIRTNSLGDRDREPRTPGPDDGRLGVLFLGDSFTWGDEARREDRFSSLLETSCGSHCGRLVPVRARNKGVIGYGTVQSYLQYLLTRGDDAAEIVILALFTGNDLSDNTEIDSPSGPRPRLVPCDPDWTGQTLCLEGVPVPPVVDWPEHRWLDPGGAVGQRLRWSGTVTLATRLPALRILNDRRVAAQLADSLRRLPIDTVPRRSTADLADRVGVTASILAAMDRTIREDGRRLGVLVFPSALAHAGQAADELRDYRAVLTALERLGIPSVDYYERTRDIAWQDLFTGSHGHWRPSGHAIAADLLRPLLIRLATTRPEDGARRRPPGRGE